MVNSLIRLTLFGSIKRLALALFLITFSIFSKVSAQCDNIGSIGFSPMDTLLCGTPATVDFVANVSLDSTPVLLSAETSSPGFSYFFSHNFPTANNGCLYYLEVAGTFTIWNGGPGYYDAYSFFNIDTNQFISEGTPDHFYYTPPLFISPNSYNPNHVYQYYYEGNGSNVNVAFLDDAYFDNDGSMVFLWYAVPCFEYLWDFGDNTTSSELNPTHTYTSPGTYQVTLTVTDSYNLCSDSFTSTITVNPLPVVDLGEDIVACENETPTLDATAPNASYLWQDDSENPTFEVTQTGLHWVDVTALGCSIRDSINVSILNNAVSDIATSICQGDVVTVGNNNYDATGFYSTMLTTSEGCDSLVNLDLTVVAVDAIINTPLALDCNNSTVSLDGSGSTSGSNISYLWTTQDGNILNGENTATPEVNGAGLYQLLVTYDDGTLICAATDTVTVFENTNPPNVDLGEDTAICNNETLILDVTAPNASYAWQDGSNNPTFMATQSGLYWVDVTIGGCTARDSINVSILNNAISDIATSICQGDVVTVGNNNYDATGFYSTMLTTSEGCDSLVNLDLTVVAVDAIINVPLALDCNNSTVSLDGNSSTSGSNISYLWTTQDGNILNGETTTSPEVNGAGLYELTVTYDDGILSCSETEVITVFENTALPIADAGIDQMLNCAGDPLVLDGSNSSVAAEITYEWSTIGGNIVSGNNSLTPLIDQIGVYTLLVTNEETGCTASDSAEVGEETMDIADFNIDFERPTCFGDDGMIVIEALASNGPYEYSIDGGENYFNESVFDFLSAGDYSIAIKNTFGCEVNLAFYLPVPIDLTLALEPEVSIQYGESYPLNAEINIPEDNLFSINWTPALGLSCDDCLDPVASPVATTEYTITVVDHNGCEAQAQVVFDVKKSRKVFIPNAFSPLNRDGLNDVFKVYTPAEQVKQVNVFQIFNRWGGLVYQANLFQPDDLRMGWDGTFGGKVVDSGVFIYYIEIEFVDGKVIHYKGDVTVVD